MVRLASVSCRARHFTAAWSAALLVAASAGTEEVQPPVISLDLVTSPDFTHCIGSNCLLHQRPAATGACEDRVSTGGGSCAAADALTANGDGEFCHAGLGLCVRGRTSRACAVLSVSAPKQQSLASSRLWLISANLARAHLLLPPPPLPPPAG
jgi:hypothetical protein